MPRTPARIASRGFTLIELLVVMTVLGIMLGLAVPSFKNFIGSQRAQAAADELSTSLLLARSEAIKRNTTVTITPVTTGDWTSGWSVTYTTGGVTTTVHNMS